MRIHHCFAVLLIVALPIVASAQVLSFKEFLPEDQLALSDFISLEQHPGVYIFEVLTNDKYPAESEAAEQTRLEWLNKYLLITGLCPKNYDIIERVAFEAEHKELGMGLQYSVKCPGDTITQRSQETIDKILHAKHREDVDWQASLYNLAHFNFNEAQLKNLLISYRQKTGPMKQYHFVSWRPVLVGNDRDKIHQKFVYVVEYQNRKMQESFTVENGNGNLIVAYAVSDYREDPVAELLGDS